MTAVPVKLPDFIDSWPWKRELNPHYEEVKKEANAWAHSFGFFDAKSQNAFDRCDFCEYLAIPPVDTPANTVPAKLAMLTYSYMNKGET